MSFYAPNFYNPNPTLDPIEASLRHRAVLFIFQPMKRPFDNQAHRPLTYNLPVDLLQMAHTAAHNVNMGKSAVREVEHVINNPYAANAVMPNFEPTMMLNLSDLSGNWRFLLVINGEQPNNPGEVSVFSRGNNNRALYFGYFVDEPLNPRTMHSGNPTLNDFAQMAITHKTFLQSYPAVGGMYSEPTPVTMADADILDPHAATLLATRELQINDPLHLNRSADISCGPNGEVYADPLVSQSNNLSLQSTPIPIDTKMHGPQDNLTALLRAAIQANGKLNSDSETNRNGGFLNELNPNATRQDLVSESIESYFQSSTSTIATVGLRPDVLHKLGAVYGAYRPEVFPFVSDNTSLFATYDQTNRTMNAMFCTLLCSAIPPLLMQAQLLHFAFRYTTRDRDTLVPDLWEVYAAHSAVQMSDAKKNAKISAIMHTLQTGLFRMIGAAGRGDFVIHGSFGAANVSHCYLDFHCDDQRMVVPFEVPTIFGGLTSTLMADPDTTWSNTANYSKLLNAMTGAELKDFVPEMQDQAPLYGLSQTPANPGYAPAPYGQRPPSPNQLPPGSSPFIPPEFFR